MGFGKKKRIIREAIGEWSCFGYFGYGQGRASARFSEAEMRGKSACYDICTRANACRTKHHEMMAAEYPDMTKLVESTARLAHLRGLSIVEQVDAAMVNAAEMNHAEALKIRDILLSFNVGGMTDHYRCGQFQNIQDGLDGREPGFRLASRLTKKAS